jgi:hypothetical protein
MTTVDGPLSVDLDSLQRGGTALARVAGTLAERWSQFSSQVEAMGDIFGDDDVGSLIGVSYQAAHQVADESFRSVIDSLGWFGGGLAFMGRRYAETEQQIADRFTRLGG